MSTKQTLSLLVITVFLLRSQNAIAQAPYFKQIVYDKERKDAKLLTIHQDKTGYIWLGTNFGICRYDGHRFRYLEKDSNEVTTITENNNGVLWIGHSNGIIEFVENLIVKKFLPQEGLPKIKITDILFDKKNRLWFSTYGEGIYCYEDNLLYNFDTDDGLSDKMVYDLLLMQDNTIWAATDLGISKCLFQNKKKTISVIDNSNGLPDNIVRNLQQDDAGNVWIAMQDKGVCYIDKLSGKIVVPEQIKNWKYGQVNCVLPMKREVFIGTEDYGIIEIHYGLPEVNYMIPVKNKKYKSTQQLILDNNEQVWMVADNMLSLTNSNRFQIIEIPAIYQEPVKAIATDKKGQLWFASKKGLFFKKDNNSAIEKITINNNINAASIISLYADVNNNLWIGTYNSGVYFYSTSKKSVRQYSKVNGLIDDNVFSIAGNGNEIWFGTLGGASKADISTGIPVFENFTKKNGLANNYVYNVFVDCKNNKWFATDGSGICKLDSKGFQNYNSIPGLERNIAYTSTEDIYGNIWFTGTNSGLFKFDGKKFTTYNVKQGLHDKDILNVVADAKGNLLISHPEGLEIFNVKKEHFTFYGAESGFENINPQINAWCKTANGNILIGASDKIIQYSPSDTGYSITSKTVLNEITLFFKPINPQRDNIFTHNENHFTFNFAGLWYTNPEAVSYMYQLKGYSDEWITSKDNSITFPNLPPGNYSFNVKSSASDDFRFSNTTGYSFTINKAFWKTWWFYTLLLLLAGAVVYFVTHLRLRLIRLEEEKEKQKLKSQLAILKNQLNPHFLFNSFNTLMNIIDKDKVIAMEFTEKLSDFYRELVLVQDKESITVNEELTLLKNYIYLQQKRFGDSLMVSFNIADTDLLRHIPPLTLQLLAENSLKHNQVTSENPLLLKIDSAQGHLIVSNSITPLEQSVKSVGIGLNNIRQRVNLLTGKALKVIESKNEFSVIIPLK